MMANCSAILMRVCFRAHRVCGLQASRFGGALPPLNTGARAFSDYGYNIVKPGDWLCPGCGNSNFGIFYNLRAALERPSDASDAKPAN
jgi:hypothetical protein